MTTKFLDKALLAIAPHECLACGIDGSLLCEACVEGLQKAQLRCYRCTKARSDGKTCDDCARAGTLEAVFAATSYSEVIAKELVHRLKFAYSYQAAEAIACAVVATLELYQAQLPSELIITHVPTATSRIRRRGYDQAQLIARAVARQMGVPYASLLVRMTQERQLGQSGDVRRNQLGQAFRVRKPWLLPKASILLVDDVITTGSTCEAAAAVLKRAGAEHLFAVAFAQA